MQKAEMASKSAKSPPWLSWNGLAYYGETVGFVLAWVAGVAAIVYSAASPTAQQPPVDQMAVAEVGTAER